MELKDGETFEMQGSGKKPYILKNTGGVISCDCPAWRNQSLPIDKRTCKHLRKLLGDAAEEARIGATSALPTIKEKKEGPPILLANSWTDEDISGWWISEKLDGIRAYWDGKEFISRLGNVFFVPDWFKEGMPKVILDGELWLGRKMFTKASSIIRRQDKSDAWKEIKYLIFDMPNEDIFEDRVKKLQKLKLPSHCQLVPHSICESVQQLKDELAQAEANGLEGLMLRKPKSKYEVGRSSTLLKVKPMLDDEAIVVGYTKGTGKYKGQIGALMVKYGNIEFKIGTGLSAEDHANPPPIGSLITFKYPELNENGIPRFASYVGIRADI